MTTAYLEVSSCFLPSLVYFSRCTVSNCNVESSGTTFDKQMALLGCVSWIPSPPQPLWVTSETFYMKTS